MSKLIEFTVTEEDLFNARVLCTERDRDTYAMTQYNGYSCSCLLAVALERTTGDKWKVLPQCAYRVNNNDRCCLPPKARVLVDRFDNCDDEEIMPTLPQTFVLEIP